MCVQLLVEWLLFLLKTAQPCSWVLVWADGAGASSGVGSRWQLPEQSRRALPSLGRVYSYVLSYFTFFFFFSLQEFHLIVSMSFWVGKSPLYST